MMLQIAIISNPNILLGKLTKFYTGCYAYHIGFVINNSINPEYLGKSVFYDMYYMRRSRLWENYYPLENVKLFPAPVDIPEKYFIDKILQSQDHYGIFNYAEFAVRGFMRRLNIPPVNFKYGIICSQMVNDDLIEHGWKSPWPEQDAPPSPCDFLRLFCPTC